MKVFITFLLLFIVAPCRLFAVPAFPKKIPILVNGDTVYIQLKGDEGCKYAIDEYGYTLLPTKRGWYYAKEDVDGKVTASDVPLSSENNIFNSQNALFFANTCKGIRPERAPHNNSMFLETESHTGLHSPAIGPRRVLVVLMQFKDKKFTKQAIDFEKLFNEENYTEDGAIGSVCDYYSWASYGQIDLHGDVMGPYTSKQMMSYYGGNAGISGRDQNPYALFEEAIQQVTKEVNLSDYDVDGDGFVDNIHIIYAGYGEEAGASADAIWAHEMTFRAINIQGMKIDRYSCAPELRGNKGSGISRIGPHCHEIGHALGAMDYYDTDYETGGSYDGTGKWDIMASGSWNNDGISPADFNPYVKVYNFGWTEAKSFANNEKNVIGPSSEKGNIFRVNTGIIKDFFLLENRNQKYFHAAEPGKGLLIFHIGPHLETRASSNTINSTYPQQCYVVCASSSYQRPMASSKSYGSINSNGCPYPGTSSNTVFSDTSIPAALTVNGKKTGINISNIRIEGQNIVLDYSNATIDDQNDSTPDAAYLWGEDFEQLRLPNSWTYTDVERTGKFEVVSKLTETDSPQSPKASSGQGYAKFSEVSQSVMGNFRTIGELMSPRIKLADGHDYILSFAARKYNRGNASDSITIVLYNDLTNEDCYLLKTNIGNKDLWKSFYISIPADYNLFTLGLICNIGHGSTLFLDNICIFEQSGDTGINELKNFKPQTSYGNALYSLSGQRLATPQKGFNIVDGKKVIVR